MIVTSAEELVHVLAALVGVGHHEGELVISGVQQTQVRQLQGGVNVNWNCL